jgi:hypothetical protein
MASIDMLRIEWSGRRIRPLEIGHAGQSKGRNIIFELNIAPNPTHSYPPPRGVRRLSRVYAAYFLRYRGECGCPDALCQLSGVFGANDREPVLRTCMFRVLGPFPR